MLRLIIVYTVIIIAAALHAHAVHATEAAYRGAVAANWCNYLGPDCKPYGLSQRGYIVFRYLTAPESMSANQRSLASRELGPVEDSVATGDREACMQGRDIAKAMRGSPSPDMKRRGRELFDLVGKKCD